MKKSHWKCRDCEERGSVSGGKDGDGYSIRKLEEEMKLLKTFMKDIVTIKNQVHRLFNLCRKSMTN